MTDYSYNYNGVMMRLKDINLSFPCKDGTETVILRNVNAEIKNIHRDGMQQGQVNALLGPSGMGKTQLFKILAGLSTGGKMSGHVYLGTGETEVHAGLVGVVAQNYPLFNHRSVLGNLLVAGEQSERPVQQIPQAAKELLEIFDLTSHAEVYPCQLSGGQRQRVAIAQQMMCSKYFMLMDEPFSGLDPLMIVRVLETIKHITEMDEFNTTIIVTHDIGSAIAVADTLWLLGRERDPQGTPIPGAFIKHTFDLAKMGLAWHPDIRKEPLFAEVSNEVRDLFPSL